MSLDAALVSLLQTIRRWLRPGQTLLLGMIGLPGAGKSTLATKLIAALPELRAETVSLDDFYLTRQQRQERGLPFRGPPGTHDLGLLERFLLEVRRRDGQIAIPVFDRGTEERASPRLCQGPLDLVVLEGFLVGIDAPGYEPLRRALDRLIFVEIPEDAALLSRRRREAMQVAAGRGGMTDEEVVRFWQQALWPQVDRYVLPVRSRADVIVSLRPDHSLQMVYFSDGTLLN